MISKYDDIINLPHHESKNHPRLTMEQRAAQFAPFAALTGYEEAVSETGRITNQKIDLDESQKEILNNKLQFIKNHIFDDFIYNIMYFRKDPLKEGGEYITSIDRIRKLNEFNHQLLMNDETLINIDDIYSIDCEDFPDELI